MGKIDELVEILSEETRPLKVVPHPFSLSAKWVAYAAAYLFVSLAISGVRPDLAGKLHDFWFDAEIASLLFVFGSTVLSASLLAFPDMHQKRGAAMAPIAAFALFLAVLFFSWRADLPPPPLPVHSYQCTLSITLVSFVPAVWTFISMRKFASTHFHLAGATALLSAFSVGAIWLRLEEINNSIVHVLEWHYLPMLAIAFFGWRLGRFLLKW